MRWKAEGGGRKSREWISHRWLQRMTGRSGAAVAVPARFDVVAIFPKLQKYRNAVKGLVH